MFNAKNLILGAGISGLGAAYALWHKGEKSIIIEKNSTYGGLCSSFEIDGFRFDHFIHLSFSQIGEVNRIFNEACPYINCHIPNPFNLYNGTWIKHPAQNNLFPLSEDEKKLIIDDFQKRPSINDAIINDYEDWLRLQFGNYFAEHFPMVYTRKYWMKEAKELRTEWVGTRVYQPSIDEVIAGSKTIDTPNTYYAKEMRYPKYGGYKQFLTKMANVADIRYRKKVVSIDANTKKVQFDDGTSVKYNRLISSIPLPELVSVVKDIPKYVTEASDKLECTSGYHISIVLKTKNIPPYLWWYIYDKDILAARVHSPSLKSSDNAPEGCSSLQMEVYCKENEYTEQELLNGTVGKLVEANIIKNDDILFTHVGFEKYANIIFTEPIYEARKIVRDYMFSVGIETIGRFGEWDYLWSDQALMSGYNINLKCKKEI